MRDQGIRTTRGASQLGASLEELGAASVQPTRLGCQEICPHGLTKQGVAKLVPSDVLSTTSRWASTSSLNASSTSAIDRSATSDSAGSSSAVAATAAAPSTRRARDPSERVRNRTRSRALSGTAACILRIGARELLDEEGHALAQLGDMRQRRGRGRPTQDAPQLACDVRPVQPGQPDPVDRRQPAQFVEQLRRVCRGRRLGSCCHHHHDPAGPHRSSQVPEQPARRTVSPVQILDGEQNWLCPETGGRAAVPRRRTAGTRQRGPTRPPERRAPQGRATAVRGRRSPAQPGRARDQRRPCR